MLRNEDRRGYGIAAAGLLLVAILLLPACRRSRVGSVAIPPPAAATLPVQGEITAGEFVEKVGTWEYDGEDGPASLIVKVVGGNLIWSLQAPGHSGFSEGTELPNPSVPWFVYFEGRHSMWSYDGQETLHHAVWNEDDSSTHETARGTSEFRLNPKTRAPQAVLDRLPEAMRGLIPPAPEKPRPAPKPSRPSI